MHVCGQTPTYFTGSDVRIREPDLPLLHWALAFKGASWTDPDAIPLMVIQSIIGAWNKNAGAGAALPCQLHSLACFSNDDISPNFEEECLEGLQTGSLASGTSSSS